VIPTISLLCGITFLVVVLDSAILYIYPYCEQALMAMVSYFTTNYIFYKL